MDLDSFVKDRMPRWQRLEKLLNRAENAPDWELDVRSLQELVSLYRQASSDLNHARSLTADPSILDPLNELAGRGYRFVYRNTRRRTFRETITGFFRREVPGTFQKETFPIASAGAAMLLGAIIGFVASIASPALVHDLIPDEFFAESPKQRVENIEQGKERIDSVDKAASFGAMLFTHNIKVSFLAFSLGALTVLGAYWILFYNGVIVGAILAQYYLDGVTQFFVAWVGPHGALELPAIVFSGAAGVVAGRALLMPGNLSRAASLRLALPSIRTIMLMTAVMLVVAGLIEGSFSQFSAKTVPYSLKIGVAASLFLLMLLYLFMIRAPRKAEGP